MKNNLRMHFEDAAFLISKPLQLMIALSIAQENNFSKKPIFIIVDAFNGAQKVAENLSHVFTTLQSPVYCATRNSALKYILKSDLKNIFIDSDVGVRNFFIYGFLKLINRDTFINVYEEGLGTYRADLYSGFKKNILNSIGVAVFFGSSIFVNSVYVYKPHEYTNRIPSNRAKVRPIRQAFPDFLKKNLHALKKIFNYEGVTPSSSAVSTCTVYLSDWSIDKAFLKYFEGLGGDLFFKPHPAIKLINYSEGVNIVDSGIPAEIFISDLIEKFNRIVVFDCNSSVRRYIDSIKLSYISIKLLDNFSDIEN